MTLKDVIEHNRRVPVPGYQSKDLGAGTCDETMALATQAGSGETPRGIKPGGARPSISTDEAKLNKTERAFLAHLRANQAHCLHVQAVTLKLAHDCRLTVDFTYLNQSNWRFTFVDVKGWQREDALIKMKVAARMFPEFDFVIVKKTKDGWDTKTVAP